MRLLKNFSSKSWILILALLNFYIYYDHYTGANSFPFDFSLTYYGFVSFWVSAVQNGIFPDWVPYQAMGYPLIMNPQAYFFYLPNWFFALSKLNYTGYAHTFLQCVHILIGAIGFFYAARLLTQNKYLSLIGAIAFQFFGGFYSNSEHPDIVRAFAFIPWLIWSIHIDEKKNLERRHLALPLVLYLIGTGAYPGSVVSLYFLSAFYLALNFSSLLIKRYRNTEAIEFRPVINITGLFILGICLALPQLYPGLLFGKETLRGINAVNTIKWGWDIRLLPLLIFSWDRRDLPYDSVMTSLFITIPIFVCIFYASKEFFLKNWAWVSIFILALLMAPGDLSFVYRTLGSVFSPLMLSRHPSADYRGVIACLLFLFAVAGMKQIVTGIYHSEFIKRTINLALVFLAIICGLSSLPISNSETIYGIIILSLTLIAILSRVLFQLNPLFFAIPLVSLIIFDGFRMVNSIPQHWKSPSIDEIYQIQFGLKGTADLPITKQFKKAPASRPARTEEVKTRAWIGYLDGTYHTDDYTGLILKTRQDFTENPVFHEFIKKEWSPLILKNLEICNDPAALSQLIATHMTKVVPQKQVGQRAYANDDILYDLDYETNLIFLENELYFPGWKSYLSSNSRSPTESEAISCKGFRAWRIDMPDYTSMRAKFTFPYSRLIIMITLLFWALYFSVIAYTLYKAKA